MNTPKPNLLKPVIQILIFSALIRGGTAASNSSPPPDSNTQPQQATQQSAPTAGSEYLDKPLPIKFTAMDGREVDLAAMKGKVVLINFWNSESGPCGFETPILNDLYKKSHDAGLEIVGINLDKDKSKVEQFIKEQQLSWPQYFDGKGSDNQFAKQFGIQSLPTLWLIDKDGTLLDINARQSLVAKVKLLMAHEKPLSPEEKKDFR